MSDILVVTEDVDAIEMLSILSDAGHHTTIASTFEEAKRALAAHAPDLVIADGRLGAFNGLHVILRARAERPNVRAIVTTRVEDNGLRADARSLNIECMVIPQTANEWLGPISRTLAASAAAA